MHPIVIVGSGLAAYSLARELRKLDAQVPITLVTADDGAAYSKPMLSNAFSRGKTAEQLVSNGAEDMAHNLNVQIRPFTVVNAINPAAHHISLSDGSVLPYQKLVLAVGADPVRLQAEGDVSLVHSVNDLADYQRFRQALAGKRSVALIGGGLIGCEFANDLLNADYEVTTVEYFPLPLGRLLPAPIANELLDRLQQQGLRWLGERTVSRVLAEGEQIELQLNDGSSIRTDVVLSALGLKPRIQLAQQAGLTVKRGIVVDEYLRSSDADIYALGDCAEVMGQVLPFVMPLMIGAKALAKTLTGQACAVVYPAMPVVVKTPAYPLSILPAPNTTGSWSYQQDAKGGQALYCDEQGKLAGFVVNGELARAQSLVRRVGEVI